MTNDCDCVWTGNIWPDCRCRGLGSPELNECWQRSRRKASAALPTQRVVLSNKAMVAQFTRYMHSLISPNNLQLKSTSACVHRFQSHMPIPLAITHPYMFRYTQVTAYTHTITRPCTNTPSCMYRIHGITNYRIIPHHTTIPKPMASTPHTPYPHVCPVCEVCVYPL